MKRYVAAAYDATGVLRGFKNNNNVESLDVPYIDDDLFADEFPPVDVR